MTLVEFLRARLDEDRAEIDRHPVDGSALDPFAEPDGFRAETETQYPGYPLLRIGKGRAVADLDAKRSLLGLLDCGPGYGVGDPDNVEIGWEDLSAVVLAHMALPYADHPDYDPGWKP